MSRGHSASARAPSPRAAPIFAALGDETRLELLRRLSDAQARSISELSSAATITRQAITKHLRVLEDAGLVRAKSIGRESLYRLKPQALDQAQNYLATVSRQWEQALARLQQFVEKKH